MAGGETDGPTVLVVDDYADTRRIVRWMLEQKGYRVVEAVNGREAVEVALREHPRVILMDLAMPQVDGFAAIREVREHAELADVRVVAVTAFDMAEARDKSRSVGCDHYISKPIDFNRLFVMLEKLLRDSSRDGHSA